MGITKHAFERAATRGVGRDLLYRAMAFNSEYYSCEFGNGSNIKRIFNEINLLIKLTEDEISQEDFDSLKNLCLVVNKSGETLITVYKKNLIRN